MHLLYEEDGEFKVGTALAQAPASFQVETPHGRRAKIKAASVLLQFERPAPAELLAAAQAYAAGLDSGHGDPPCERDARHVAPAPRTRP